MDEKTTGGLRRPPVVPYLTSQPYGWLVGTLTGLPAIASWSAMSTWGRAPSRLDARELPEDRGVRVVREAR